MTQNRKIGIIGAGGWLGSSLARSLVQTGFCREHELTLSYRSKRPDFLPGAVWTKDNLELVNASDVVVLSVRPEDFPALKLKTSGKLLVSFMAGVSLHKLSDHFGTNCVVRALPNAAIEVQRSYTPWIAHGVSASDKQLLSELFGAIGEHDEVFEEAHLDYFAASTGTGPAYIALLCEILEKDAIAQGIAPLTARKATQTLLFGSSKLIEAKSTGFTEIVDQFVAYDGMTAAALRHMQRSGMQNIVHDGIRAALERAKTLKP